MGIIEACKLIEFERGVMKEKISTAERMIKLGTPLPLVKKYTQLDKKTLNQVHQKISVPA